MELPFIVEDWYGELGKDDGDYLWAAPVNQWQDHLRTLAAQATTDGDNIDVLQAETSRLESSKLNLPGGTPARGGVVGHDGAAPVWVPPGPVDQVLTSSPGSAAGVTWKSAESVAGGDSAPVAVNYSAATMELRSSTTGAVIPNNNGLTISGVNEFVVDKDGYVRSRYVQTFDFKVTSANSGATINPSRFARLLGVLPPALRPTQAVTLSGGHDFADATSPVALRRTQAVQCVDQPAGGGKLFSHRLAGMKVYPNGDLDFEFTYSDYNTHLVSAIGMLSTECRLWSVT